MYHDLGIVDASCWEKPVKTEIILYLYLNVCVYICVKNRNCYHQEGILVLFWYTADTVAILLE